MKKAYVWYILVIDKKKTIIKYQIVEGGKTDAEDMAKYLATQYINEKIIITTTKF